MPVFQYLNVLIFNLKVSTFPSNKKSADVCASLPGKNVISDFFNNFSLKPFSKISLSSETFYNNLTTTSCMMNPGESCETSIAYLKLKFNHRSYRSSGENFNLNFNFNLIHSQSIEQLKSFNLNLLHNHLNECCNLVKLYQSYRDYPSSIALQPILPKPLNSNLLRTNRNMGGGFESNPLLLSKVFCSPNLNLNLIPRTSTKTACQLNHILRKASTNHANPALKANETNNLFKTSRALANVAREQLLRSGNVERNPGPGDERGNIRMLTYNVRGLGDEKKLRHLLHFMHQHQGGKNSDFIACLQETYIEGVGKIPYIWRGNFHLTKGNGHSCGCLTLLSPHLNVIASKDFEQRGHVIACQKVGDSGVTFIIANIYAPNPNSNDKLDFFNEVFDSVMEFKERYSCDNAVILGDFNLNLKQGEMKNRNYSSQEQRIATFVKELIDVAEMTDLWERRKGFTWRRPNTDIFSTIDRIVFTRSIDITNVNVNWSLSFSDHAAVVIGAELRGVPKPVRSRITRLDPDLAKKDWTKARIEQEYQNMIATMPNNWDPHRKLEFAKVCIRSVVEQVQAERKRKETSEEESINEELDLSVKKISSGVLNGQSLGDLIDYVETLRSRKEAIINEKGERLAARLGSKWYNEGEKSTKYFLRLLNRAMPDDFKSINGENGEITNPEEIEKEIVLYYRKLYENYDRNPLTSREEDGDFFKELSKIPGAAEDDIVRPIDLKDLTATLHSCSDSAPGPDGIPYSILGLLWNSFGPLLLEAWNYSLRVGKLPPSHKVSYLKLIPKAGKNLKELTNWRPITLSNCDHKLITKTYANRMCKNVASSIKTRQTAYVKDRLINDNLRAMLSTVNISNLEERAKGLLISLDARKAFDSVEHSYIENCLNEFGCGRFVPIFKLLYSELATDIIVNGRICNGFKILRGVKQGDALSCIIFIMCMEPLLRNLEANAAVKPIETELLGELPKVYAYADDVNCTVADTDECLQNVFNEYERLTNKSGLTLNADKTELMTLGSSEPRTYHVNYTNSEYEIKTKEKIKINGILFQRRYDEMVTDNVNAAVGKMDKMFRNWSRRNLSTLGRVLIVETFGISQLIYLMQTFNLSNVHFKHANNVIYKFIWNRHYLASKAPERIKREIMNKPVKLGGYGMLDVASLDESIKIKAVGRLLSSNHPFLELARGKCVLDNFFEPRCPTNIEPVMKRGLELLKLDRNKIWTDVRLERNALVVNEIRKLDLSSVLSREGRLSIPYFMARRRGHNKIGELTNQELNDLTRHIDGNKLNAIRNAKALPIFNNLRAIDACILIKGVFKDIAICTSKEIRESRTNLDPIKDYKIGIVLTDGEALTWATKINKLTSTRHKNLLLKVAHGEVYTKERLHRFGLIDSNACPRCGLAETLVHKFFECHYVSRIWQAAKPLIEKLSTRMTQPIENSKMALGMNLNSTLSSITLNSEILTRIMYLKDDQDYLIRPKALVANCLKTTAAREKRTIGNELAALLED